MGGKGSGGHNRISDEEKRRRGTFHADRSEEVYAKRAGEKVITGLFLARVPEPEVSLNEFGRKKYDQLATLLFNHNKLTEATCIDCQLLAMHWENVEARKAAGKAPSSDSLKQIASITQRLRIAEDAPAIANPNQKNRFAGSGFSNNRASPYRLRPLAATGKGEL